jgi:ribose-phosphate pyrophosphokinase
MGRFWQKLEGYIWLTGSGHSMALFSEVFMPKFTHNSDCGMYGEIQLFAGTASPSLASSISRYLDLPLNKHEVQHFPNDNLWVRLGCSVRGQDTYVIQTTSRPTHRNLMELLITLQTLRLDSAGRVTAVIPYLCYARSDKKDKPRVPITARLVADMIEIAGADRYMTLDLHAGQIQGFFSIPGDVLSAFHILTDYILNLREQLEKPVVLTADLGFAKKGRNFAAAIDASMAFVEKRRTGKDDRPEALTIIGDVAAPLLGEVIRRAHEGRSVGEMFNE